MRLTTEQIERLRVEFPEAYEVHLELVDISAQAWNALVWFAEPYRSKFRGKLCRLAVTLRDRRRRDYGDERTAMDSTVEAMQREGWFACSPGS